ncbi:Sodium/calcium exchanger protein-domain-containing protein [Biscogniauxia mediterranea]|nr:Sodium/calcium exchanger protein-domain-containing protein [Biscogniauxia mediterranea]
MKESSSDQAPYLDRIRSWARSHAYGGTKQPTGSNSTPTLPISNPPNLSTQQQQQQHQQQQPSSAANKDASAGSSFRSQGLLGDGTTRPSKPASDSEHADKSTSPASEAEGTGPVIDQPGEDEKKKPNVAVRFFLVTKKILLHSWINVFLIFVPVGIVIANIPGMNPGAIFGINAIAIIPLAALLSHATESVARKLGDTVGALLNVTFGNAVELIIFIALVKGEIRIVQASLLGSILANLLLILGMAFFLGGLRFREQIYNSTVTQMSACLLSLSVISLVLPTAFHASFRDKALADEESLKISRGTSVILLLVYVVYLLFQLKSHAYMYESTPQHIIDEESTPGPAAAWLDTSSSESSSSSDSDSDGSSHSRNTMSRRVKRAIRRRRRKSSVASADTDDGGSGTRTSSFGTNNASPTQEGSKSGDSAHGPAFFPRMNSQGSEEAIEEEDAKPSKAHRKHRHKHAKHKHRRSRKHSTPLEAEEVIVSENIVGLDPADALTADTTNGEPRRVDFADNVLPLDGTVESTPGGAKRPFNNFRGLSFRPVAKSLAPAVFTQPAQLGVAPAAPTGPVPRVRYGIRRTNSLPERLNQYQYRPPGGLMPVKVPSAALVGEGGEGGEAHEDDLSRMAAIMMLLISTALVATCAEFMVDAIDAVVANSALKEIFIGLIILPIVGNAAEHVTAVAVAMKNKMDLAIGVAIGSSIQIALFLTPLVVILGWIIDQPMTLYFTLFETVCLFVSAFIINFLILDGRSNYLEGALLCATYVIIAIIAFFYPEGDNASDWSA